MDTTHDPLPVERLEQQLMAVRAWNRYASRTRTLQEQVSASRELRMDAARRVEALRRTQDALRARADLAVEDSLRLLEERRPRLVVAHRNAWLRGKLVAGFDAQGFAVLAELDDGADGLGTALAEQPDVLLLEEPLPSMPTLEVIARAHEFVPGALIAAQVEDYDSIGRLLDAGAQAVFSRRVPPAVIVDEVCSLLTSSTREPLVLR